MSQKKTFVLSAGGTGGHLFPAEALAHELKARGHSAHLATDERAEKFADRFPGPVHAIPSATIAGRNPLALIRAGLAIWKGMRASSALFSQMKPSAVIGFGGYPTLPPLLAATRAGIPTLIHEQNAVMGRANKLLSTRVTKIAGGFLEKPQGPLGAKTIITGNPIRPAVIEAMETPYVASSGNAPFHLLIFGGSQGAKFFSDALPPAIEKLSSEKRLRLRIVQQARMEDEAAVRTAYANLGVEAEVSPFFNDMAARIANAQLVISRSGASTVSEVAAIGRPAIFVPYPHALDHDQAANAAKLEKSGGARVIRQQELSAARLADLLASLMDEPQTLSDMAGSARSTGTKDAARLLADAAEAIADDKNI
ncbi:undecaprenyldiphospho-muramoylpentapeptide beta-N-acetylglucosaminyltransferase [Limoniibacter endophyticus]|uniref:UDP-N-acetylglucosamine--N-acetylmuramyl-(pentapeptide) pyrophosphoryl-undecaprenol N-acetylglucosamine transferase n=1 Tax=Limoniibacter endophyticus TaxID=1565040 RepID=A0A8J3DTJ2_9HYPH|nr:undecaprenyldiphospho-muramoylpentapeptide beta-N-acetylglucosaminyltransferase [Limoniibacter endophyticus]GHC75194.1 UDP-N-acetylglucosamine--N-acetylmuramyl-(pentapeptide) pyrophosphoryl-undecaprenol N-acetylglucosamine transferase [Limoniibacter endophyticus]